MAGKRVNSEAPLTAAEKQKRYRQKKEDEEKKGIKLLVDHFREKLHVYIDGLSDDGISDLCKLIIHGGEAPVTLKEISEMTGISMYELNKLESKGVISPISDEDDDIVIARFLKIFGDGLEFDNDGVYLKGNGNTKKNEKKNSRN